MQHSKSLHNHPPCFSLLLLLLLPPPNHARPPSFPPSATAAAAGDAQPQPWQPPQQPQGLFRLPRVSLWSLGGPLAWGYMLGYLALMLILPISALLAKSSLVPLQEFVARAAEPVALSAYFVSFSMALLAGAVNAVFGFLLAWVLVKYDFPGVCRVQVAAAGRHLGACFTALCRPTTLGAALAHGCLT